MIALGDKNSKTLGHFPRGAFMENARKKWIITAKIDDVVIGYLGDFQFVIVYVFSLILGSLSLISIKNSSDWISLIT